MLWLLVGLPLAYVALLYVGSPLGSRPGRRPGTVYNTECDFRTKPPMCNWYLETKGQPIPLGRHAYDRTPKKVMLNGVEKTMIIKGNGWVLQ